MNRLTISIPWKSKIGRAFSTCPETQRRLSDVKIRFICGKMLLSGKNLVEIDWIIIIFILETGYVINCTRLGKALPDEKSKRLKGFRHQLSQSTHMRLRLLEESSCLDDTRRSHESRRSDYSRRSAMSRRSDESKPSDETKALRRLKHLR